MADAGTSITTPLVVKVTTAGTAVPLVETASGTSGTTAKTIVIQALSTNEEPVVVGDKNVKAKVGTHASPEQRGIELKPTQMLALDLIALPTVFVDSRKNDDGVAVLVLIA